MGLVQGCLQHEETHDNDHYRYISSMKEPIKVAMDKFDDEPLNEMSPIKVLPGQSKLLELEVEEETPEDTESTLLSDPRFAAFLIQSPSLKREISQLPLSSFVSESTNFSKTDDNLDELYNIIKQGDVESFMDHTSKTHYDDLTSIRFENTLTPLHVAVIHNQLQMVQTIIKLGMASDEKDLLGRTPLDWAILDKNEEIQNILRSYLSRNASSLLPNNKNAKFSLSKFRKIASTVFAKSRFVPAK